MDLSRIIFVTISVQFGIIACSGTGNDVLPWKVIIGTHERMIQRLEKIIDKQGKRITELENNCVCHLSKVSDDVHLSQVPAMNESMTSGGLKSHHRELETNTKGYQIRDNSDSENQRFQRLLIGTPAVTTFDTIAFYAYLGTHDMTPAANKVVVFETVLVNTIGNAYNNYSGVFTIPESGIYVFTWTIECDGNGSIFTNILRNSNVFGSIASDSHNEAEYRMSTGVALNFANKGDVVFIRVHTVHNSHIHSSDFARSSFSGWKLK